MGEATSPGERLRDPALPPTTEGAGSAADALDELIPPEDSAANVVLVDGSRAVRWAGVLFGVCAVALVPWTIYLGEALPSRVVAHDFDVAWIGFDIALLVALAATAWSALRRSRHLTVTASFSAALLLVDAWFDVVMSRPGPSRNEALAMAVLVEVPLAVVCLWLARHAEDIAERRIRLLLRERHSR
ncbi:hypothetical protein N865_21015 [Intrasporangium oryzae NRRL B-24470]|uniref:DUF2637 domain-containing protein n=1 Tax=Intrasporangium oryzae NRRL B-24470 TaxID=1386089 RepID=W9G356_9MICO|nr:hypothetical protein [Intrasporangium oryzae]EWS99731.1 hypothetical protein N865_21015 [Intrasporangium oryzae NRRL B-24470]